MNSNRRPFAVVLGAYYKALKDAALDDDLARELVRDLGIARHRDGSDVVVHLSESEWVAA